MEIVLVVLCIAALLGALSVITAIVSALHSFFQRAVTNTMRNTRNIRAGAEVVSVTPEFHKVNGLGLISCDVIVKFSDGSYYCKSIGQRRQGRDMWHRRTTTVSYNEYDIREALIDAMQAHEKCAREKR